MTRLCHPPSIAPKSDHSSPGFGMSLRNACTSAHDAKILRQATAMVMMVFIFLNSE